MRINSSQLPLGGRNRHDITTLEMFWPELQQTGFPFTKLSLKTARDRLEKPAYSWWPWMCLFGSQWSIRSTAVHSYPSQCVILGEPYNMWDVFPFCKYWDLYFRRSRNSGFFGTCPPAEPKKAESPLPNSLYTRLAPSRVGPWQQALTLFLLGSENWTQKVVTLRADWKEVQRNEWMQAGYL